MNTALEDLVLEYHDKRRQIEALQREVAALTTANRVLHFAVDVLADQNTVLILQNEELRAQLRIRTIS